LDLDEWCDKDQAYSEAVYWIPLDSICTPAQVLDFLLQVNGKKWSSPQLLQDILDELEVACRKRLRTCAQGAFCPGGTARRVDWRRGKSTPNDSDKTGKKQNEYGRIR